MCYIALVNRAGGDAALGACTEACVEGAVFGHACRTFRARDPFASRNSTIDGCLSFPVR